MPYGYHGGILHIDLTAERVEVEEPDETFYRKYMGGSAMGAYYLLKHTPLCGHPTGVGEHPESDGRRRHRRTLLRAVPRHRHSHVLRHWPCG